jgi:apolipoprotein D and lipocalin family protein
MRFLKSCSVYLAPAVLLLAGCISPPDGVKPVQGFEPDRYLGTWYEIARLDHSFEEGLSDVVAHYSLRDDGGLKVVNRGYSKEEQEWTEAEGKAYFVEDETVGHLKVSFFGPFYGAYVIFELDKEGYDYSFVSGPDKSYLWLLARSPEVSDELKETFISRAKSLGFDTSELIFVEHGRQQ